MGEKCWERIKFLEKLIQNIEAIWKKKPAMKVRDNFENFVKGVGGEAERSKRESDEK